MPGWNLQNGLLGALVATMLLGNPAAMADGSVYVSAQDGTVKAIPVGAKDGAFLLATWCPYCKGLVRFLNDAEIKPYLKNVRLRFVFMDEWPTIEYKLGNSQQVAVLKRKSGHRYLYDPRMASNLPGAVYFITPSSEAKQTFNPEGVPAAYNERTREFDLSPDVWFKRHTTIPHTLLMKKLNAYKAI